MKVEVQDIGKISIENDWRSYQGCSLFFAEKSGCRIDLAALRGSNFIRTIGAILHAVRWQSRFASQVSLRPNTKGVLSPKG